jgi:hypothetical protein
MTILYILIVLLVTIILFLSLALYLLLKKGIFISDKEKEFIVFVIDIFIQYGDDLGIQSKEEHQKITTELNRIKDKYFTNGSKGKKEL